MYSPTRRDLLAASALLFARRLRALPLADLKLGITTDEIHDDVLTAAKFLQQYNLHWAEIRNIWGPYNTAQPMEKIREAGKILDEHGIRVSIEGTGFFKIPLPPDTPEGQKKLDAQWALLTTAMERAKAFGTDKLRVFTFMLAKGETPNEKSYARVWELTREAARRAKGFRLAVENIGGGYVATGAEAALLFKNVKEDNIGLTWDPNNAGESGEQSFPRATANSTPPASSTSTCATTSTRTARWSGPESATASSTIWARSARSSRTATKAPSPWKPTGADPKGKMYSSEQSLKGLLEVIAKV